MTNAAGLYGQSLYDLAAEENLTDEIMQEMDTVDGIFRENPDYIRLLLEPSIHRGDRLRLLDDAFRDQIHPYLLNFLKVLTEKGLLREYRRSLKRFRTDYNRDHGITEAVVTTAVPLTDSERDALLGRLEKISGKKVFLTQKVNTGLLAGVRVELDGRSYDGTVKGRLDDLRSKVSSTVI